MENVGLKGLLVTLYQRVILSYKTTLIGIAVAGVPILVENLAHADNKLLTTAGLVIGSIFALVKEKLPAPPPVALPPA